MVASLFDEPDGAEVPAVVAVEALPEAVLEAEAELPPADELPLELPPVVRPEMGKPAALQS